MSDYADFVPLRDRDPAELTDAEHLMLAFQRNPQQFVRFFFQYELWHKQVEIFEAIRDYKRVSVASGHNIGKTFVTACICVWFLVSYPHAAVLTTATTFKQVQNILWKEIRRLVRRSIDKGLWTLKSKGLAPKAPRWDFGEDRFMEGFGFDRPDAVQGCHNPNILIVFDEAQAIDQQTAWDAFSSMMTGPNCKHLAIGNPLYATGPFPKTASDDQWHSMNISCLEHPNYVTGEIQIMGALTKKSIDELRDNPMRRPGTEYWLTRVEGKFPQQSADSLLPRMWVERASHPENFSKYMKTGAWIGFDVAGQGSDRCVVSVMVDGVIEAVYQWADTTKVEENAKRCMVYADKHNVPFSRINFDAVGPVGSQYKVAFQSLRVDANPIYNGQYPLGDWDDLWPDRKKDKSDKDEKKVRMFLNRRAELHWTMRTLFLYELVGFKEPKQMKEFCDECSDVRYGYNESGILYIEKKERFIKRNSISPDINDSVTLLFARDAVFRDTYEDIVTAEIEGRVSHRNRKDWTYYDDGVSFEERTSRLNNFS